MGNEEEAQEKKRILTKLTGFTGSGYRGLQSDDDYNSEFSTSNLQIEKKDSIKNKIQQNSENNNEKKLNIDDEEEESEVEEEIEEQEEISEKPTIEETVNEENEYFINHTFLWNEGGKNVKITGTFSNWKERFEMIKDPVDQSFKLTLKLKKIKYEYKFIVDGKWKYSKKQKIIRDKRGIKNNFIDLSTENNQKHQINEEKKIVKKIIKKIKKIKKLKKIKNKSQKKIEESSKNSIIEQQNLPKYGCIFPEKKELNEETKIVQESYMDYFIMNNESNQKFIGRDKFLKYKINDCYNGEKSFIPLLYSPHVNLNHTLTVYEKDDDLLQVGLTSRFRDKDCTFVYYSHLNQD